MYSDSIRSYNAYPIAPDLSFIVASIDGGLSTAPSWVLVADDAVLRFRGVVTLCESARESTMLKGAFALNIDWEIRSPVGGIMRGRFRLSLVAL